MKTLMPRAISSSTMPRISLRDPTVQSDLLLVGKTTVAAVASWVLAAQVFGLPQAFLAPWAAMLTVHASVYRTLSRGTQQVGATVLGVILSYLVAEAFGISAVSLGLALLVALLTARLGVLRAEGMTIATTVLFVLTTGYEQQEAMLGERILATGLGIGAGVLVNLVVLPPLNNRSAAEHVDVIDRRIARALIQMSRSIREDDEPDVGSCIEETRDIDADLDRAWELVAFSRESLRLNPRRRRLGTDPDAATYEEVLHRIEDGVAELRSIARTVQETSESVGDWDGDFRGRWADLLEDIGNNIGSPGWEVSHLLDDIDGLCRDLSSGTLEGTYWPTYGSLLVSARNIVKVIDDVASSQPVRP